MGNAKRKNIWQSLSRTMGGVLFIFSGLQMHNTFAAAEVTAADLDKAVEQLRTIRPNLPIEAVYATDADGLLGVDFPDGSTMYITADGKHMIVGDMYAIGSDLLNVSEQRRSIQRKVLIDQVALSDMVIFPAKGEAKAGGEYFHRRGLWLLSQAAQRN